MRRELARFAVVGGIGFITDAGLMTVISSRAGLSPLAARTISFPIALCLTWMLNRFWTFEFGRSREKIRQYGLYIFVQTLGFAINYGCFSALVTESAWWHRNPVLAVAVGALMSMLATFALSRRYVFSLPRAQLT